MSKSNCQELLPVLVATHQTQGQRPTDCITVAEGELVTLASVCDRDRGNPDGGCGCARAFVGIRERTAVTTAVIAERTMTRDDYLREMRDSAINAGFLHPGEDASDIDDEADELLDIAAGWPVGTVVERRDADLQVRRWPGGPGQA
ncbi:hypothetical protein AB8O55_24670 [Saccharopolyspora cebuensis]|uniref:DUF7715 domain-containing protein n=1 Tax=Saccharopolyspora cebuensis TaxID=418759 RepID=A0ABV4CR12_9PSEU